MEWQQGYNHRSTIQSPDIVAVRRLAGSDVGYVPAEGEWVHAANTDDNMTACDRRVQFVDPEAQWPSGTAESCPDCVEVLGTI